MELVHAHIAKIPPSVQSINPNIPPIIAQIIAKLMAKNAEDRYQSAAGLRHDLETCLSQLQITDIITDFILASRDITDQFIIPEKLYGREQEVETLLQAFERVANGNSEIMLVTGFSGIGKTVVVNEVHKPIVRQRGYFIKGKFDQFQKNIPFSAFVQAFLNLIEQLLGESDEQIQQWKTKILNAVGENGQVIIDVIPELAKIIGEQPSVPELSGIAAQNRFNFLFEKFMQIFTTKEHPLVIFLDDLQWADSASLKLMQLLIDEFDQGYLLLIGAYRDNEVFPAHPLMLTLNEIKKSAPVNTINLAPLKKSDLNNLVANTLSCNQELAMPLTHLIYQKTQGNPFFATQYLKSLHEDKLIEFNLVSGYWQCDITQIQVESLTDDIVEFMAWQLHKLPTATQNILKLAACIGNQFDFNTLLIIYGKSLADTAADLWTALQEGLIVPINQFYQFFQFAAELDAPQEIVSITYRFLHDRVQQGAYALIPDEEKQLTHLQIGQLLLNNLSPQELEKHLFDIVNHLNLASKLIVNSEELITLAKLNLQVAKKALQSTAYSATSNYAKFGIELLPNDSWQTHYELTLGLYNLAVESTCLEGQFEEMFPLSEVILSQARSLLDTIPTYDMKIHAYGSQNQLHEAIAVALDIFSQLGLDLPDPVSEEVKGAAFQRTAQLVAQYEITQLDQLPQMSDPVALAVLKIASRIAHILYFARLDLFILLTLSQVEAAIIHGNALASIHFYANYSVLNAIANHTDMAKSFAQLTLQLIANPEARPVMGRVLASLGWIVLPRMMPYQDVVGFFREAYFASLETGDLEFAAHCADGMSQAAYFAGQELSDLASEMANLVQAVERLHQTTALQYLQACYQAVLNLQQPKGKSTAKIAFDEAQIIPRLLENQDFLGLLTAYSHKTIFSYLIGDIPQAQISAEQARNFLMAGTGCFLIPVFLFYDSLVAIASDSLARVEQNQAELSQWVDAAPMNFQHKSDLVTAELHRVSGDKTAAIDYYDKAIQGAKANNFIQEEALANELVAKFYLDWGKDKVAQAYMQEAYYCYSRWGATAKIHHLEKCYPQLLVAILQAPKNRLGFSGTSSATVDQTCHTINSSNKSISQGLDFATILKASQSLSSEIQLEKLLTTLMQVVMENAGAKKATLLVPKNENWIVEALATQEEGINLVSIPYENSTDIPLSLINYVKRSCKTIVWDDATTQNSFIADPYLIQQQPKSVLCMPILHQGKLIGILYLENQLTIGTFTSDRLEIIQLLSAQAAISLENARLYQEAQEKAQQLKQSLKQQKTLFNVVNQVRQSLDLDAIFRAVTQNIRRILDADRVGIYQFHLDANYEYGEFIAEDVLPAFTSALAVKVQDHCFGENYATLYKQGRFCALPDVNSDVVIDCHRAILAQFQVKAALVVPIMQEQELWGLLCIHQCDRPREWQASEIQFAQQVGAQMGVALKQTDLFLETQNQATQLQQTLEHLQQTQLQLVQNEKMSALGNLVAGVAHEINNPVGFIAGNIQPALDYIQDLFGLLDLYQEKFPAPDQDIQQEIATIDLEYLREDLPKILASMAEGVSRIRSISTSLRTFSRADTEKKIPFNIHEGLDSTILILKHRLKANEQRPEIAVITEYGDFPDIECFPGQLNQVFMNILANAIDALDESNIGLSYAEINANPNQITIKTFLENNQITIIIADNGQGMTEEVREKIFDHLFTTKTVGQGTGLGLAIARQIVVEKHGGNIEVVSELGKGAEFIICIPCTTLQ
ncbi:AAA family ATPase [Nostoc sp. CCY0012]|uniref:trifunctional serine/threonine-protein kinase/ATP-binding protein/sensor histidine kinase n=1 Tax=Nostoc sp. CCY0012 TaxID=1056123 RepID=UPI0039C71EE9